MLVLAGMVHRRKYAQMGFAPPKRTPRFTAKMITRLLTQHHRQSPRRAAMGEATALRPQEYWVDRGRPTVEHPGGDPAPVAARRLGTYAQSSCGRRAGGDLGG